ncbi:MAG TPA: DUF5054 domain-containing protein [Acidobacteriaceae bacterium]|nr:DUF5054 domain-containing protein [Acidobacteriaceae bacterium]
MQRRQFIRSMLATGAASICRFPNAAAEQQPAAATAAPDPEVRRVLAMFKCHFDAGFIDTQAHVIARYFQQYFPEAIATAQHMRQTGDHRYVWTTGSWLLFEYLEQANGADRKAMEEAIARGDIAWHALPFNWQTELIDESMIAGSLALSDSLDRRFGKKTTGAKMTDVPGHTRGLIAPLAAHGVTFLDVGVNGGSHPADVPEFFVWQDTRGGSLTMMYHHEYGDVARVPGSDLAIAIMVRGDNSGPHKPQEIDDTYAELAQRFPNAQITATSLTEIASAVQPFRSHLPTVTQEIGDTWIYGVASDPLKLARYREVARLRRKWIAQESFRQGDAIDVALLRKLLLEPEHTWGTDTKTWLDFDHYKPAELAQLIHTKNYEVVQFSWQEKRQDLLDGVATLPQELRQEAEAAIRALDPMEPTLGSAAPHPAEQEIETPNYVLGLDPATGAIRRLRSKKSGREWASADHPLALFSYQTLSQQDFNSFFDRYIISHADWVAKDFGKPNIERKGAVSRTWHPLLSELSVEKNATGIGILGKLQIRDATAQESGLTAYPERMYLELDLPNDEPEIHLNFYWFGKPATRMPEALWLTFNPVVANPNGWSFEKSGETISPFDVVSNGGRHMHAVSGGFGYSDGKDTFSVDTIDAPLIAIGERSPLNFSRDQPDLSGGVHSCLFNNAWGTNYIMWYGENMRFRYVIRG